MASGMGCVTTQSSIMLGIATIGSLSGGALKGSAQISGGSCDHGGKDQSDAKNEARALASQLANKLGPTCENFLPELYVTDW